MNKLLFLITAISALITTTHADTAKTGMRDISSMEIVANMGVGWNLGNTLDAETDNETGWGNPKATKSLMDAVAKKGFKTLRLPVTWKKHQSDNGPEYVIEKEWMDRAEEVANYAFKNNMYVILNVHHDEDWIIPEYNDTTSTKKRLEKTWTQIANRFKDYGDYLIFETLNEPRVEGDDNEWNGGSDENRECVNIYHRVALDAIRATGGNNAKRHIMISTHAASTADKAMNSLVIPHNDPNTIVSLHSYFPFTFCLGNVTTWGTASEKSQLDYEMNKIYNKFTKNGIPVVLGEWCETNNNNLEARMKHAAYYVKAAAKKGFCPVYWDVGAKDGSGLVDRTTKEWYFPGYADTILNNYNANYVAGPVGPAGPEAKAPYGTSPISLPGRIECENYDKGGEGVSYHDLDDDNKLLEYRADGVDIEVTGDTETGFNLGYVETDEWLEYTVDVQKEGDYSFGVRAAVPTTIGSIQILVDDKKVATIELPKTGGWQTYETTIFDNIALTKGEHVIRVAITKGGFNINYIDATFDGAIVVDPTPEDTTIIDPTPEDTTIIDPIPEDTTIIDPIPEDTTSTATQIEPLNVELINVYPNPAIDYLKIDTSVDGKLILVHPSGAELMRLERGKNRITKLAPGVYYVILEVHGEIKIASPFYKIK